MPVVIKEQTYYRTSEVCQMLGVSRNTLFRWLRKGLLESAQYRDWRTWRLFTEGQIQELKERTTQITDGNSSIDFPLLTVI